MRIFGSVLISFLGASVTVWALACLLCHFVINIRPIPHELRWENGLSGLCIHHWDTPQGLIAKAEARNSGDLKRINVFHKSNDAEAFRATPPRAILLQQFGFRERASQIKLLLGDIDRRYTLSNWLGAPHLVRMVWKFWDQRNILGVHGFLREGVDPCFGDSGGRFAFIGNEYYHREMRVVRH
jgi:hypothetical protein